MLKLLKPNTEGLCLKKLMFRKEEFMNKRDKYKELLLST